MANFPRTIAPNQISAFTVPAGYESWGETGKGQFRSSLEVGRQWFEQWPPLLAGTVDTEAFIAFLERAYRTHEIFDIAHLLTPGSGKAPNGVGGGTPLVKGASQVGATLLTDGWTHNLSNIVRAGDVIRLGGLNLLYRVMADAASNNNGEVSLTIEPPLITGLSPADNAVVTRTGCTLRATIAAAPNIPAAGPDEYLIGLRLAFRECP